MFNCLTSNFKETGDKYAKVFTLKKNFKGNTDWHNNQVVFTIFQANSYNGYTERKYFLATIRGKASTQTTIFKDVSSGLSTKFKAVIVEDDSLITVYVKGIYESVPVRVRVDYCGNIGMIEFTNYGKFNNDLTTFTESENKNKKINISFEAGWTLNTSSYFNFSVKDNLVNIKCSLKSGVLKDNIKICKINECKPSKPYRTTCTFVDSGGNFQNARIIVNEYGDILVSGMNNKATTNFDLDISFYV